MKKLIIALFGIVTVASAIAKSNHTSPKTEKCYGIALINNGNNNASSASHTHDPCSVTKVPVGECEHVGYKDKSGNMHYGTLTPPSTCKK